MTLITEIIGTEELVANKAKYAYIKSRHPVEFTLPMTLIAFCDDPGNFPHKANLMSAGLAQIANAAALSQSTSLIVNPAAAESVGTSLDDPSPSVDFISPIQLAPKSPTLPPIRRASALFIEVCRQSAAANSL